MDNNKTEQPTVKYLSELPVPETPPERQGATKRSTVFLTALVLIVVIGCAGVYWFSSSKASAVQSTAVVDITHNGFVPATIQVAPGQTVEWLNEDNAAHQPATDPYPLENGLAGFRDDTALQSGDTYSFTFKKAGTYTYHDHLNPFTFDGTVVVK